MMEIRAAYVKPEAEIIEFVFEESIASSAGPSGAWFNETIWGNE
ncbi:MAG: hypothetical protein Q7I99_08300 [Acholeplasmataceae bacterium]|nr:hypothetical protein [Acholeplasmataceae bacterium]